MKKNIVKVFKKWELVAYLKIDDSFRFPDVTFIWKYEKSDDGIAQGAENVYLTKWALQNDLLGMKNNVMREKNLLYHSWSAPLIVHDPRWRG